MTEAIIVGLISAGATLTVSMINNRALQKKADIEQDKRITEYKNMHEKALIESTNQMQMAMQQMEANLAQKLAISECKMDDLTRKVEKHNGVVERTYKLENDVSLLKEKQTVANHRIDDLERR